MVKPVYDMDEVKIIRYLLDEIEEERAYNEAYDKEWERARKQAQKEEHGVWYYFDREKYPREKRQSIIKDDIKTIRRLALKMSS